MNHYATITASNSCTKSCSSTPAAAASTAVDSSATAATVSHGDSISTELCHHQNNMRESPKSTLIRSRIALRQSVVEFNMTLTQLTLAHISHICHMKCILFVTHPE